MSHAIQRRPRLRAAAVSAVLAAGALVPLSTAGPADAAPYCGITWGSGAKTASPMSTDTVRNVRAGRQACFDRLVVDLSGYDRSVGYSVRYVSAVTGTPGTPVPLAGAADLQINLWAPAYDGSGRATYRPADPMHAVNVSGYQTFRQVAYVDSFEGETTLGLGVRARLPMRAFVIQDAAGQRLVIDVAHRW
ncbi:AMIN-like domain-containing (lipo)protein [Flexivirga meconopsidis]|uniref:AMIN-like domain-containing (lipo)protein n=1 Tax=Flexivirga meconopsidis TaxID=2977121 RepID=UPI0022404A03|nr:hypothetical protein [Flexivirga meconopsidis]